MIGIWGTFIASMDVRSFVVVSHIDVYLLIIIAVLFVILCDVYFRFHTVCHRKRK